MENTLKNFRVETDDRGVATAILDVPERGMNVFEPGVIEELESLVADWEHAKGVKAIVFKSGKASGFLAGADINVIESIRTPRRSGCDHCPGSKFIHANRAAADADVRSHPRPVPGWRTGVRAGVQLPHRPRRQLHPAGPPGNAAWRDPRLGRHAAVAPRGRRGRALEMILTAKKVSASAAKKMGLVHLAPSPDEFDKAAKGFVETVIASPSSAAEVI